MAQAPPPAPPAKKAPEKAPAAPAKQPAAGAKDASAPSGAAQSAWVKLCETAVGIAKDKDGKEEKKELNICLTHHERLDGNTGMVLVSAAVRQVEGQDKQHFMVMVPLGMMLQAGMRATLYPKDAWEKVQKNEKVDESKLKAIKLAYTLCHPAGCTAEMEATPELHRRPEDWRRPGGVRHQCRRRTGRLPGAAHRLRSVVYRRARGQQAIRRGAQGADAADPRASAGADGAAKKTDGGAAEGRSGDPPQPPAKKKSDRQCASMAGRPDPRAAFLLVRGRIAASVRLLQEQRAVVAVLLDA